MLEDRPTHKGYCEPGTCCASTEQKEQFLDALRDLSYVYGFVVDGWVHCESQPGIRTGHYEMDENNCVRFEYD